MRCFLILVLFILSSCSTWDRETCLTTDWYKKGVEDASESGSGNFNPYKRECAKEGVSVAAYSSNYDKGLLEGMRSWCTFQMGFNQGLDGKTKTAMCDNINPAFARGVEEGYREFRVVQRRKRDEEERKKRYDQETDTFKRRVLLNSQTKECYVDSDCRRNGDCTFGQCKNDRRSCHFNSDCEERGVCREISDMASDGTRLTIRVCDYN